MYYSSTYYSCTDHTYSSVVPIRPPIPPSDHTQTSTRPSLVLYSISHEIFHSFNHLRGSSLSKEPTCWRLQTPIHYTEFLRKVPKTDTWLQPVSVGLCFFKSRSRCHVRWTRVNINAQGCEKFLRTQRMSVCRKYMVSQVYGVSNLYEAYTDSRKY